MRVLSCFLLFAASSSLLLPLHAGAPKKRLLLLWQKPDGHPKDTHEYELGQRILKRELDKFPAIDGKHAGEHPVLKGLADFEARAEFYYTLKCAKAETPLLNVTIDGEAHTVAWALERTGGGRSFGFSGLHFHENWQLPEYRRLV